MVYSSGAIRPAEPADAHRVGALLTEAFVVPPDTAVDPDTIDMRGRWVLDGDEHIDATAWAMGCGQWFGGRQATSRAVAGVAVASDRRGVGAGRALMTELVRRAARDGAAVMTLYPSTIGFYRSLGFEIAGMHLVGQAVIGDLPKLRSPAAEVVEDPDVGRLSSLYEGSWCEMSGPIARPDWWWDVRVLDRSHPGRRWTVVVRDGSEVTGYAVLSKTTSEPGRAYYHGLTVHDTAWRCADAASELLGYLRGFVSLGDSIRWPSPPGDHWLHLLTGRGPAAHPASHPWMLRILDIPAALSFRGWPVTAAGEVVLDVRDAVVATNQGRWRVALHDGVAEVARVEAAADLSLDVTALTAAFTGWRSITDLARHGLVSVRDATSTSRYDAWFSARPWLGERF